MTIFDAYLPLYPHSQAKCFTFFFNNQLNVFPGFCK